VGGAFEIALLDAGAGHAEVGTVAQHGEQDAAEPMGHGYHCGLVAEPRLVMWPWASRSGLTPFSIPFVG
jgi:hypothetical protein